MKMTHEIRMPVLSQSMIQGRVVEWLLNEGDKVNKGALLVVVESDKATHELEAPQEGILRKILVVAGSEVDVDTPLAIIADEGEQDGTVSDSLPSSVLAAVTPQPGATPLPAGRRPVSPAAKKVAQELGIDISNVPGSGEDGLVTEKDVRVFVAQKPAPAGAENEDTQVIPLIGQRGRIAERMALSRHTAADVTTVMDVDMRQVVAVRASTKYSYTAYVAWAAAQSLHEFPLLNAWVLEDKIIVKGAVHMGVAVAIESALVVPVIRHAERMNVGEIDQTINALGAKARDGQLTPDDMKGSTFTVTNSGVFGSLFFTPIINLPEVAVLGIGKVAEAPVVQEGQVVASKVMYLCLSYDHRAVDGATAVQFLQAVKNRLENPE
jgi:pyruvate/2-oxoglutarate dehydrogenase complex dihydrolipoamide acyltransferase (E2) component